MADKYYVRSDNPVAVPTNPFVTLSMSGLVSALLVGLGVGLVSMGVYLLLNHFIFSAALCRAGVEGCSNAPLYSTIITAVIAVIMGVVALARVGTYRPLLVALASTGALWSLYTVLGGAFWLWAVLIAGALFALAYGLFAWVARVRSFIIAIIALVVLAVVVRLVLG